MPTIAIVDGIRIVIYPNDHNPPHFHAFVAEHRIRVEIASGAVIGPSGPGAMERKITAWALLHRSELLDAWNAVRQGRILRRIG